MTEHYHAARTIWPTNAAAYYSLAEATIDNLQQHAMVADVHPDLPCWLAEAIRCYAVNRLGHQPQKPTAAPISAGSGSSGVPV